MRITSLNHVALHVTDLAASKDFYHRVLNLTEIPRPDFNFPGAWFSLGPNQSLHLIADNPDNRPDDPPPEHINPRPISHQNHFALTVSDITRAANQLDDAHIEYTGPKSRPDGIQQIFLRDPDGHIIELCNA